MCVSLNIELPIIVFGAFADCRHVALRRRAGREDGRCGASHATATRRAAYTRHVKLTGRRHGNGAVLGGGSGIQRNGGTVTDTRCMRQHYDEMGSYAAARRCRQRSRDRREVGLINDGVR